MNCTIDEKIYQEFRKALNATNVFGCEKEYVELYNLGYALLDRMEKCVGYINAHTMIPNSEEEFLLLMMYGSMVVDAVKLVLHLLEVEHPYTRDSQTTYSYFADVCEEYNLILPDGKIPTDDKVWEYIRSLSFAHPFETSRAKFLKKDETQYSPAIIANIKPEFLPVDAEPTIGILVYSTAFPEIKVLNIPYTRILGYISSRYQLLALGTERIKQIIEDKKQEWAKQKVQVGTNPLDTLKSAAAIMESRHEETALGELVLLLEVQSTFEENRLQIRAYQSKIESAISQIVMFVESLDTDGLNNYLEQMLQVTKPKYGGADYQIQKIFSGLNQYADEREQKSGLKQADAFYKDCGYKWVKIDVAQMGNEKIKLLVRIACEQEAQNKK
jgi:hypothetical protein